MFRWIITLLVFIFVPSVNAYDRIVLLAPSAGDILLKLGAQDKVVGVTRSNDDFPNALKVGSHIKPNVELIKGLNPDLVIISSKRFFSDQMIAQIGAETYTYNPVTLDGILQDIDQMGDMVNKPSQAKQLVSSLKGVLQQIHPLANKPKVVFEVTENPFMIAGKKNIVNSIIDAAGGELFAPADRKIAKFNLESILVSNPGYYIYQVGPMNKNPTPPEKRANYQILHSQFIKVDQLSFSRATTESFYHALELNQRFNQAVN